MRNVNDTRVYVTEPAKWVARLHDRATKTPMATMLRRG